MPFKTPQRKSLVVGGSRGLGLAIADDLAAKGYAVTTASRFSSPRHQHISCDLSRVAEVGLGELGPVIARSAIIFVVAAEGCFGDLKTIAQRTAIEAMKITFVGNVLVLSHAVTTMSSGSSVCWVSSLSAHAPTSNWAFYAASKAGVGHFVECVRPIAAERDVSLTVAYPGNFKSNFHEIAGAPVPDQTATPSDLAAPIVDATIKGSAMWVAPMDREALAAYLSVERNAGLRLRGALS